MDLNKTLARAVAAAKHGDLDGLEVELVLLSKVHPDSAGTVGLRLRTLATCVREHPSYQATQRAEAV
jgi:hypothetical protein